MGFGETLFNQRQQVKFPHFIEEETEAQSDLLDVVWPHMWQVQDASSGLPDFQTLHFSAGLSTTPAPPRTVVMAVTYYTCHFIEPSYQPPRAEDVKV